MGLTPAQADHEMVQRHAIEVIEENFTRWAMLFGAIVCALLPVSLGLFMYLFWSFAMERSKDCDEPLNTWFIVVLAKIVYHLNVNGKSIHKQVVRVFCRYDLANRREPTPTRVRLYLVLLAGFVFVWHCLGLHWVHISKTCRSTAPNLYRAVRLFAAFNVAFTIFATLFTFGLSQMLASLLRRGLLPSVMLRPERVAPEGTLELQQTVPFDAEAFGESSHCPTCLEDFSAGQRIKRTVCGHHFHEECLSSWLRVNWTCPLCRADLAARMTVPVGAAELDEEAGELTADAESNTVGEAEEASPSMPACRTWRAPSRPRATATKPLGAAAVALPNEAQVAELAAEAEVQSTPTTATAAVSRSPRRAVGEPDARPEALPLSHPLGLTAAEDSV